MARNFVLHALRLLSLEEILKLSQALKVKQSSLKKAVGESIVAWDEDADSPPPPQVPTEGKLLKFKRTSSEEESGPDMSDEIAPTETHVFSSEFLLWQREFLKDSSPTKSDAMKGYTRSNEMYVIKNTVEEAHNKIHFASTRGVLVNKKQS